MKCQILIVVLYTCQFSGGKKKRIGKKKENVFPWMYVRRGATCSFIVYSVWPMYKLPAFKNMQ